MSTRSNLIGKNYRIKTAETIRIRCLMVRGILKKLLDIYIETTEMRNNIDLKRSEEEKIIIMSIADMKRLIARRFHLFQMLQIATAHQVAAAIIRVTF